MSQRSKRQTNKVTRDTTTPGVRPRGATAGSTASGGLAGQRRLIAVIGLVAVAAVLVAVAVSLAGRPTAQELSPGVTAPPSPIEGRVTDVVSEGLDRVRSFQVRTDAGETWDFAVGNLDNAVEFPPGHLKVHQADGFPVVVSFTVEDGVLVAYHLADPSAVPLLTPSPSG